MITQQEDRFDRVALHQLQTERLRAMIEVIVPANKFYARKWTDAGIDGKSIHERADISRLPFTTKSEIQADQAAHPPYGSILTFLASEYCRLHQTSGTSGQPLRWLDTADSWKNLLRCWEAFFRIIDLRREDRLFFPFSFGPFLGFWTAFEAASRRGYFCIPGGGMSSSARLKILQDNSATVVFCTPTYAMHLAEVADEERFDLAGSTVRALVVAGEPGGSIGTTRARIESAWGARVFDHCGLTEVGPVGIECPDNPAGLHLLESEYLVEVIDSDSGRAIEPGQLGELVLTNLGRVGSPLIRYRTGDLVRVDPRSCPCGRHLIRLDGGILGRTDDMIHVRGNNLYPSALEAVIRRFPAVTEFRLEVDQTRPLAELRIDLEVVDSSKAEEVLAQVEHAIREELLFRAEIRIVEKGSLPRFEMKARRLVYRS